MTLLIWALREPSTWIVFFTTATVGTVVALRISREGRWRRAPTIAGFIFLAGVLSVTLPARDLSLVDVGFKLTSFFGQFTYFWPQLRRFGSDTESLLNIGLYVPCVFSFALATHRFLSVALLACALSFAIESSQAVFGFRAATALDVVANCLGVLIATGLAYAWTIIRVRHSWTRHSSMRSGV